MRVLHSDKTDCDIKLINRNSVLKQTVRCYVPLLCHAIKTLITTIRQIDSKPGSMEACKKNIQKDKPNFAPPTTTIDYQFWSTTCGFKPAGDYFTKLKYFQKRFSIGII